MMARGKDLQAELERDDMDRLIKVLTDHRGPLSTEFARMLRQSHHNGSIKTWSDITAVLKQSFGLYAGSEIQQLWNAKYRAKSTRRSKAKHSPAGDSASRSSNPVPAAQKTGNRSSAGAHPASSASSNSVTVAERTEHFPNRCISCLLHVCPGAKDGAQLQPLCQEQMREVRVDPR
ncbi:hypothetical protein BCR44DRAFT_207719 [Catenaria anguillulae PL171]|uniref:Uncharacterized protein n=1 Tax=Catenaria anguillulae PL171 TaxID=765915 RepID=A0A1Y2HG16_9FUNG|nr:hypothetical protein BCR44DRAFT_207719 [Catenaria anguillulae PL171]